MNAETTPLEERLITLIRANGPISLADYMSDALGHPHEGYYTTQTAIGAGGDFTTAPEISQIFGELIGLWLVQSWIDIGEPDMFNLVEFGPGRGVLMADILRTARIKPEFLNAANIYMVETSGRLRHEQQRRLRDERSAIDWVDSFSDVPEGPTLIVANEFFDCLPIRQYERKPEGWRERLVGLREDQLGLAFTHAPTPPPPDVLLPPKATTPEDTIIEICDDQAELTEAIARRLIENTGRALIIDYGRVKSGPGETLQAVRSHEYWPVLSAPGRADITAHVDFEAINCVAIESGAGTFGPVAQGEFLQSLGLAVRIERLCAQKSPEEQAKIHAGAHRISSPSQMGETFKTLCISSPDLSPPSGF